MTLDEFFEGIRIALRKTPFHQLLVLEFDEREMAAFFKEIIRQIKAHYLDVRDPRVALFASSVVADEINRRVPHEGAQ